MSESREEAGEPSPLPQLQESEKSLKELRPLEGAKSTIMVALRLAIARGRSKVVEHATRK